MKHLKIASYLLIMVAFFTSCEEETMLISDTAETTLTKESIINPSDGGEFYYSAEDFDCNNLPTQNFEYDTSDSYRYFPSPLDSESDNDVFVPGDILPGISFESSYGFVINNYAGWSNVLMSNYYFTKSEDNMYGSDIVVNFTTETVYDVSMNLYGQFNAPVGSAYVEVYGFDNYLGGRSVDIDIVNGGYIAFNSFEEPIAQIIIRGNAMPKGDSSDLMPFIVGIWSISFGECSGDSDDDGCLDEDDAYPNSNMSETLSLGENSYEDIDNVKVDCGTFMQDQIDNLINQINDGYNGNAAKSQGGEDNYEELHEAFTTKLAHITYYWRINKLITAGERATISSDAWSAEIPYNDVE